MKNKYLIKSRNSWANADYEHIIEADSEKEAKEIFRKQNRGLAIMGFPKLVNDDQKIGSRKVLNEAIAEEMLYEIDNSGSDAINLKEGFGEKTEFSREDLLTALPHLQKEKEEKIAKDAADEEKRKSEEREKKILEDKKAAEEEAFISKRKTEMFDLGLTRDIFDSFEADFKTKITSKEFLTQTSLIDWENSLKEVKSAIEKVLEERTKKAKEAEEKAIADALEKERQRVEEEKEKERLAEEKREKNKRHRAKINNEAVLAISKKFVSSDYNNEEEIAKIIVEAIAKGEVPHITINY